jgi:hypothetical protein
MLNEKLLKHPRRRQVILTSGNIYIIINGILSGEHVYGLPNHVNKGVADWWYSTACFELKFN